MSYIQIPRTIKIIKQGNIGCRHHMMVDSNQVGICKFCGRQIDYRVKEMPVYKNFGRNVDTRFVV